MTEKSKGPMRSATIHRLRPAADTEARSDGKADAEAKANAAEIAAISDTLQCY